MTKIRPQAGSSSTTGAKIIFGICIFVLIAIFAPNCRGLSGATDDTHAPMIFGSVAPHTSHHAAPPPAPSPRPHHNALTLVAWWEKYKGINPFQVRLRYTIDGLSYNVEVTNSDIFETGGWQVKQYGTDQYQGGPVEVDLWVPADGNALVGCMIITKHKGVVDLQPPRGQSLYNQVICHYKGDA